MGEHVTVPREVYAELVDLAYETLHYASDGWDWKYNFTGRWEQLQAVLMREFPAPAKPYRKPPPTPAEQLIAAFSAIEKNLARMVNQLGTAVQGFCKAFATPSVTTVSENTGVRREGGDQA